MTHSMRHWLNAVEPKETLLVESQTPLTEGFISDKINAMAQRAEQKYGDVQYAFLAKATMMAMDTVKAGRSASSPIVLKALNKVLTVGKLAIQNRALLTVLIGVVSTLIGIAAHPNSAQAASQIDHILSGNSVDEIIKQLHQSGIDVASIDPGSVPHGVPENVVKAVKALKAIESFEHHFGDRVSTDRFTDVSIVGDVTKTASTTHEHLRITTPDGNLVLADIDTTQTTINGHTTFDEKDGGIKFRLMDLMKGDSPEEATAVENYLNTALSDVSESAAGIFQRIKQMIWGKSRGISELVAQAVAQKPDGTYRVEISASGVSVRPA